MISQIVPPLLVIAQPLFLLDVLGQTGSGEHRL